MKGKKKPKWEGSLLEEQQRFNEKIGARLKALRIQKGYSSHEKFAFENEFDRSQYGKYERGAADMRMSTLVRLLVILDIDPVEFFSEGFSE